MGEFCFLAPLGWENYLCFSPISYLVHQKKRERRASSPILLWGRIRALSPINLIVLWGRSRSHSPIEKGNKAPQCKAAPFTRPPDLPGRRSGGLILFGSKNFVTSVQWRHLFVWIQKYHLAHQLLQAVIYLCALFAGPSCGGLERPYWHSARKTLHLLLFYFLFKSISLRFT